MVAQAPKEFKLREILKPQDAVTLWMPSKHMGNLLVSLLPVQRLEAALAGHPCTLVIDESYRDIMSATPLKSEIIYFPRREIDRAGILRKFILARDFIRQTRRRRTALAIAMEGDKVSQKFAPLSGCGLTVGPDNRYCKHYRVRLPLDHGQRHVFYDYEAVTRQLTGESLAPGYIALRATDACRQRVKALLAHQLPYPDRPCAILHPCATKDYKQWPTHCFAELADYLNERKINVIITGAGQFDGETIARLSGLVKNPVVSLHNQLGLGDFIALLQSAAFFLGNDTGPTHLAAACGIPTLALFGPTDEFLWGPMGANVHILRSAVPCEPDCLRRRCSVNYRCMQTLGTADVISRIQAFL